MDSLFHSAQNIIQMLLLYNKRKEFKSRQFGIKVNELFSDIQDFESKKLLDNRLDNVE